MKTFKAALADKSGKFCFKTVGADPPRAGELLVRIVASGVCHTDLDFAGAEPSQILGHEGAGVVEAVGARVRGLRPGDHVVLSYQSCGKCAACRRGAPARCERFWELNFDGQRADGSNAYHGARGHFFGQSSFAEYALATPRNAVKVPKNLPLALLAPLGCGLQTGAGTVLNSLRVRRGASVVIFGAGSVGLAAVMAARIARAAVIIAVDLRRNRLRLARELGATHAVAAGPRLLENIRKIVPGGVDYALEITGSLMDTAIDSLGPRGVVANIAVPGDSSPRLKPGQRMLEIIQGDAIPQRFIPRLIRYRRAGKFPFDLLIKYYPFRQINRAAADSANGRTLKPVLLME